MSSRFRGKTEGASSFIAGRQTVLDRVLVSLKNSSHYLARNVICGTVSNVEGLSIILKGQW